MGRIMSKQQQEDKEMRTRMVQHRHTEWMEDEQTGQRETQKSRAARVHTSMRDMAESEARR
jgi:hypothetical protein